MSCLSVNGEALKRLTDDRLIYNYRKNYRFFNSFLSAWLVSS